MSNRRPISNETRYRVFKMFEGHCAYCGKELNPYEFHVDHKQALADGGADRKVNYVPACGSCNSRKNSMSVFDFKMKVAFDAYYGMPVPKAMRDVMISNGDYLKLGIKPELFFYEKYEVDKVYSKESPF